MVERRTEENQGLTKEEAMRDVMKRRMFGMGIDRTRFWKHVGKTFRQVYLEDQG